jgi:YkoY family integral membrane protein
MNPLLQEIIHDPLSSLLIVGNLVLIESLLSVDNAAVLATMVTKLPAELRKKALQYGIVGAYLFRGVCLFFAALLVRIWWLKVVGGLYLLYLSVHWWRTRNKVGDDDASEDNLLYRQTLGRLGPFWATVISVELMDLAFSIDNVFAAVAFSQNIIIILCGVFIGILAMRFVAGAFVKLMERYPFLETSAYIVISLLGIKLSLSAYTHFYPSSGLGALMNSEYVDWVISAVTLGIFFIPLLTSKLFNVPERKR